MTKNKRKDTKKFESCPDAIIQTGRGFVVWLPEEEFKKKTKIKIIEK
jgi:hypothetical protein